MISCHDIICLALVGYPALFVDTWLRASARSDSVLVVSSLQVWRQTVGLSRPGASPEQSLPELDWGEQCGGMGSAKTRPTTPDEPFVQDLVWQTPKPASGWLLPVRALRLLLRICRRDLSTIFGFTYTHDRFGSVVSASGKGS